MLILINKSGSLIYQKKFNNNTKTYGDNEIINLASSFYAMHNMASQITPKSQMPPETEMTSPQLDGIREIVADTFVLKVM